LEAGRDYLSLLAQLTIEPVGGTGNPFITMLILQCLKHEGGSSHSF
jgi:hypothetical protein